MTPPHWTRARHSVDADAMDDHTTTASGMAWHSVAEAAQLTGASERTVWRRVRAGTVPTRTTADGRRLVGVMPDELTRTTADLTAAAGAAAGALRAADGLSDAIRVIEAQAQLVLARADQRADDAIAELRRSRSALARWRVAAVALPIVMAAGAIYARGPQQAKAATSAADAAVMTSGQLAGQADNPGRGGSWHPPMLP